MRPLSVRVKREIVSIGVIAPWFAVYMRFADEPWSLYLALSLSYTILVFGLLWSDGKWRKYIATGQRTARDLMQRHAIYLLVVLLWLWVCRSFRSRLPDWMFGEIYREVNYYLILSLTGIVVIWWVEQSWLAKPPRKDERMGVSPQ